MVRIGKVLDKFFFLGTKSMNDTIINLPIGGILKWENG